ncbi:unnamed protein product [Dimorphilus gyrociliatus]|uniref:Uncharacterized protein n=1 Tax=Dimorphilus gyrociliatus TaxID=2664684 RepID=A0A7I8VDZ0_9ANNE|nr:unnamed protein product [Dimorphilus gyrociliatus]
MMFDWENSDDEIPPFERDVTLDETVICQSLDRFGDITIDLTVDLADITLDKTIERVDGEALDGGLCSCVSLDRLNTRIISKLPFSYDMEQTLKGRRRLDSLKEFSDRLGRSFKSNGRCFTYLLLDPRILNNLAERAKKTPLSDLETLRQFATGIFYVGKGQSFRPYAHLEDAIIKRGAGGPKNQVINSIWRAGYGVIALHLWHGQCSSEALAREASIIEAIGLNRLTNEKSGWLKPPISTWPPKERRLLGVELIRLACQRILIDGERQIKASDVFSLNTCHSK